MKLNELTKYKTEWVGFAMIWIMLYHSGIKLGISVFDAVKSIGYGGVDICFFASGIGCFYSLNKNGDIVDFFKRRFLRIVPTYWCFIVMWILLKALTSGITFQSIVGNILGIQNFTGLGNYFNWYISALICFYLFAPYFKLFVDRANKKQIIIAFVVLFALTVSFWQATVYMITVTRILIFFLGMIVGKLCSENNFEVDAKKSSIIILVSLLGIVLLFMSFTYFHDFLWKYGLLWYPFFLITPGVCMSISYFFAYAERKNRLVCIRRFIKKVGENSFELYLLHIPFFEILTSLLKKRNLGEYNNIIWTLAFVIIPVFIYIFKKYVKCICRYCLR